MNEPTLIILAAGMGSRFGGLKQITPVDDYGHAIIDFSLYDAYRAGFRNVAFIIKEDNYDVFRNFIGQRIEKYFHVDYVFQDINDLPDGYTVPEGRVKPWGTGHAVRCCREIVKGPFAVINADDFYGKSAYQFLYDFLISNKNDNEHAMVAYLLKNTVTETGYVSRGICSGNDGYLTNVVERVHIEKCGEDAKYTEDDGNTWFSLSGESLVSMNCWAFSNSMLKELDDRFPAWLEENMKVNPLKCEYYLPFVVNEAIKKADTKVRLLDCRETWYGITYKEDEANVRNAIEKMRNEGIYPKEMLE